MRTSREKKNFNDRIKPSNTSSERETWEVRLGIFKMMNTLEEEEERNMSEDSDSGDHKPKREFPKPVKRTFLEPKHEEPRYPTIYARVEDAEYSDGRKPSLPQKGGNQDFDAVDHRGKEYLKPPPQRVYHSSHGSDDGRKYSEPQKAPDVKGGEKSGKERQRRPSAFESVLQVLRRPSIATMDMFSNLRRGSGTSRSGSHVTINSSRRSSHMEQANGNPSKSETSLLLQKLPPKGSANTEKRIIVRRPSGAITFNPEQMNPHQKRYILGLLRGSNSSLPELCRDISPSSTKKKPKQKPCSDGNDSYVAAMSALYANLLCVLGIAFPVTEVLSPNVPTHFYQAYYLYLYMGSLAFMTFMYITLLKDRAVFKIIQSSLDVEENEIHRIRTKKKSQLLLAPVRYGSFYLRMGAVAFGIGSMVYSGLEFGQYFELKQDSSCHNIIQAATPVTRMILTLIQMQFIFLSSRQMEMSKYRGVAKFGLMHMIATNLCEWLNVIVEETKHEIVHLKHLENSSKEEGLGHDMDKREADVHDIFECRRANVMGSLVQDASPFLFPCTIEYSLICAVILYEMWKDIKKVPKVEEEDNEKSGILQRESSSESVTQKSNHFFSVDCSNAHKGLFSGILVLVMIIISLIIFFVMTKDPTYRHLAVYEVNVCELVLYCITTMAVVAGGWQMRYFKYKLNNRIHEGIGLDNTLLMWAQSGTYIYCMFSIIACYFMIDHDAPGGFITEMCSLIQTTCQTAFILDATFRRTDSADQYKRKPGRQIVTFLLVANMTLWLLNTLQKNRAEFRPTHLEFYGVWAWTIITHVSMPLAIFYRFHSTICLFEIWKDVYKFKREQHHV